MRMVEQAFLTVTPSVPVDQYGNVGCVNSPSATQSWVIALLATVIPASALGYLHDDGSGTRVWRQLVSSDITTALGFTPVSSSLLGVASGVATLNSSGYLNSSQIPPSLVGGMDYQGTWNAATNTPALASGTGTKGYFYKVATAGTTTIDGNSQWNVGDLIAFDGTTWDKIDGIASEVTSVFGRVGAVTLQASDVQTALGISPSGAGNLRWNGSAWAIDTTAYLSTTTAASTYAPLTGTGASGNWGISITGTAANATNLTGATQTTAVTWSGQATFTGGIRINGTGTPVAGYIQTDTGFGLRICPKTGSSYDFSVMNAALNDWVLLVPTGTKNLIINGAVGFNGATPLTKPTITGSKGANAALASLITALASYGLITDSTT